MTSAFRLRDVSVVTGGARLLDRVDLAADAGEHVAILGPNGAGKTTLLRVLSTYRFPTSGHVEVLGEPFGRVDLRTLRARVGFVSVGLDPLLHGGARVGDLLAAARVGALRPLRGAEAATGGDAEAAGRALERVGVAHLAGRRLDTLSQGERQRVRVARALVSEPELLLLDEPFAGLDLGGRESLLADLDGLLGETDGPTVVLVTHHLEELPPGIRRVALLRDARIVTVGPSAEVVTDAWLSDTFGLDLVVERRGGRFGARGA